jgi:formate dehydrogenase maturation protein FdhE
MFGNLKNFAMRKMMERQLKNAPPEQKEMISALLEKNPAVFEKIAKEMQEELKKNGNNQMAAAMKVLPKYQKEILEVMTPEMKQKLAAMQGGAAGKFNPNGSIRR